MLSYIKFIKENFKKQVLTNRAETPFPEAIEGGVVLILSKPFKDNLRRIYMALINKNRLDNETNTIRVDLIPQFYILKEQFGGKIMPEKVDMNPQQRKDLLSMNNTGLYLNDNKTPLWQISCCTSKINFFNNFQPALKDLINKYEGIFIPITQSKRYINLHENIQLANKVYFNDDKIDRDGRNLILNITNGDNYTKALCDAYTNVIDTDKYYFTNQYKTPKHILNIIYNQLKNYNKNLLPIKDFNINDVRNISPYLWLSRQQLLEDIKKLPSVAIRNLRQELKKERSFDELKRYGQLMEYFLDNYSLLSNRTPELRKKIEQKMFKSNSTLDSLIDFIEDKSQLIGGLTFTYDEINKIVEEDSEGELETIYDKNNIMVIKVTGPIGIKTIGCNSLWCFTYGTFGQEAYHHWYKNNPIVYIIIDLNEESDTPYFMHVLIKELNYETTNNEEDEDENSESLYNMQNEPEVNPLRVVDNLIGIDIAKRLFDFK